MRDEKQKGAVSEVEKRLMQRDELNRVGKGAMSNRDMRLMKKDNRTMRKEKRG